MHYTEKYLLDPSLRISVALVGCGGTGSQVLNGLGRLNAALVALGHPGLLVGVYDADTVSESNVARQLYSPADIGHNKAVLSVSRVNRFYGLDWQAFPEMVTSSKQLQNNIIITCIDTAKGRVKISKLLQPKRNGEPNERAYYWLDFGNLQKTGQVVLGTVGEVSQASGRHADPGSVEARIERNQRVNHLPNVVELLPQIKKIREKNQGPSCSLAEALGKQDLFINSALAQLGLNLLWTLFREGKIKHHGLYLNLETMSANPIKIK